MTSILFIHQRPHFAHKKFAESIGADFLFYRHATKVPSHLHSIFEALNKGMKLPKYDIYICEGGSTVLSAFIRKIAGNKEGRIVLLVADETFFRITLGMSTNASIAGRMQWRFLSKYIDGAIAVSKFAKEEAKKILRCPIRVAYPFVQEEMHAELLGLSPVLDSYNILSIGVGYPKNGMDILVESFRIVKKGIPKAKLFIIGKGNLEEWNEIEGVHVTGFVPDIIPYLKNSSLFCLIGRGQAFPVAVIEALSAGIPTMISKFTGNKETIRKISNSLVVSIDKDEIARKIIWHFNLPYNEKRKLSKKAREVSREFNEREKCEEFRRQFKSLLDEIK